ncbi:MAG TPA: hypothetical protein VIM33_02655, partial [Gaiellaceae bacterium]
MDSANTSEPLTARIFVGKHRFEAHAMIKTRLRGTRLLLSASALTMIGMLAAAQTVAATGPAT